MKQVGLTALGLAMALAASSAAGTCFIDTNQADFQAGINNGLDLTTSSGNVKLSASSGGATLDQQNTTSNFSKGEQFNVQGNSQWTGQTFTAGKSGPLTRVDVSLFCSFCGGSVPSIVVSI